MKTARFELRSELAAVVDGLVAATDEGASISLDAIGEAIGALAVSQVEIDRILDVLEERGRRVTSSDGGHGERHLHRVLDAARALVAELGRRPNTAEIAERSGLGVEQVRHALALARIMQR